MVNDDPKKDIKKVKTQDSQPIIEHSSIRRNFSDGIYLTNLEPLNLVEKIPIKPIKPIQQQIENTEKND